jgi:hypothetical protein
MKKALSLFLLTALLIPMITPLLAWASPKSDKMLFSSSFEKRDGLNLLQSQVDGDSVAGHRSRIAATPVFCM